MLSLLISIRVLILLVMYYIAHIDIVIFQVCLPSHSPLLLQYRAQNLGGPRQRDAQPVYGEGAHGGTSKHIEGVEEIDI